MKKYLSLFLCFVLLISTSLTGCQPSDEAPTQSEEKEPFENQVQIELPDLSSSIFAFNDLDEDDVASLFGSESLNDYLAASPFYTSEAFKAQFVDHGYFMDRDFLIDDIIFYSEFMQFDTELVLSQLDTLMTSTSLLYETLSSDYEDVKAYSEIINEEYSNQIIYISALSSQIEVLSEVSESAYTQAWNNYILVHKRIELADLVITQLARVVQDAIILYDEYAETYKDDLEVTFDFDLLMMELEFIEILDTNIEDIFVTIAETYSKLKALESADNYATLSTLIRHYEIANALQPAVNQLIPRDGLSEDAIEVVKDSNMYTIELTSSLIAELIDVYELDTSIYIARQSSSNNMFAVFSNPFAAYGSSSQNSIDQHSSVTIERAKNELTKSTAVKPKKSKGFFSTLYTAVRQMPGILLEKASNAVHKTTFDHYASDYGISKDVIRSERERINNEEMDRIKAGAAGSQVTKDAIGFIEKGEDLIGDAAEYALGKDNIAAKTIKIGSKFAVGCFTGGGKALIKIMDPKATPGELGKATLDITLTVIGGSKAISKMVTNKSKLLTNHLSKIVSPFTDVVKNIGGKIISKGSGLVSKLGSNISKMASKLTGALQKSVKTSKLFEVTSKKMSSALNEVTTKAKAIFTTVFKSGKDLKTKLSTKLPNFTKKAIKSDSLIGTAVGDGVGGVTENYIKGLIYDKITTLIDDTLPEYLNSEDENALNQNDNANSGDSTTEEDTGTPADEDSYAETDNANDSGKTEAEGTDIADNTESETEDDTDNSDDVEAIGGNTTDSKDNADDAASEIEDTSNNQPATEGQITLGNYDGNYINSEIAGQTFVLNDRNSSIEMAITETSLEIYSYIADPMIDGTGMTFSFDKYNASGSTVTVTNIDDEGDRQDFIITFNDDDTFSATVIIYDSNQVIGKLKMVGKLIY